MGGGFLLSPWAQRDCLQESGWAWDGLSSAGKLQLQKPRKGERAPVRLPSPASTSSLSLDPGG